MLESVVVDRPSKTKILKRPRGSYVYLVVDSIYNKEKQYTIDKKVCIGKLVPGSTTKIYPNNNYFKLIPDAPKPSIPDSSECEETNKENET